VLLGAERTFVRVPPPTGPYGFVEPSGAVEPSFEISPRTVSEPQRVRLRVELRALIALYEGLLGGEIDGRSARALMSLDRRAQGGAGPGSEPVRARFRHDPASTPASISPPSADGPPMGRRERERALARRARHEASHALVDAADASVPAWLDEGLAMFFEHAALRDGTLAVAVAPAHLDALCARSAPAAQLPLADLLALSESDRHVLPAERRAQVDAQMWSLVHGLMATRGGRGLVVSALQGAPLSDEEALVAHYPGGRAGLGAAWRCGRARLPERVTLLLPETTAEVAPDAPPRPRARPRVTRCVRGILGAGGPHPRPALFCSRTRR
jgi:hypothetical protein